jgi:crossover junction endodeoxyribonuclease RusA
MTRLGALRFIVEGKPASQGSMTAVFNARLGVSRVRHANAPALSKWRAAIRKEAKLQGAMKWDGPIGIYISFGIKAPIDKRHGYPKAPDLDKLTRAVLDALTGVCYIDDSQVTTLDVEKIWENATTVEVWRNEKQVTQRDTQTAIWQDYAQRMEANKTKSNR